MAKKTTLKDVGEMLAHVVKHISEMREEMATIREEMATKEELNAFRGEFRAFNDQTVEELRAIRSELAEIRRDLDALKVGDMSGYSKEIDHLMERVRAIEKHLGIKPQLAA